MPGPACIALCHNLARCRARAGASMAWRCSRLQARRSMKFMDMSGAPTGKSGAVSAAGKKAQSEGGKKGGKATAKKTEDKPAATKATNGKGGKDGGKDPTKTPGGKASGGALWAGVWLIKSKLLHDMHDSLDGFAVHQLGVASTKHDTGSAS